MNVASCAGQCNSFIDCILTLAVDEIRKGNFVCLMNTRKEAGYNLLVCDKVRRRESKIIQKANVSSRLPWLHTSKNCMKVTAVAVQSSPFKSFHTVRTPFGIVSLLGLIRLVSEVSKFSSMVVLLAKHPRLNRTMHE